MAREDVEALRRGYEALARRDLEVALALLDPEVQVEDHEWSLGSPTTRHGHAGFLEILTSVNEGFEDVRYTAEEFTDLGDRVLVKARRTGRGSSSGAPVEEQQFHLFDLEGGRVIRFRSFLSPDRALEAVRQVG